MLVIGAGAAGMMAAITAARQGASVTVIEKNDKIGRKLYITGKGRCNVTNQCPVDEFSTHVVTNARFVLSALNRFSPQHTITFFEEAGVPLKVERGNRVYPVSDRSADIIDALLREAKAAGVRFITGVAVREIEKTEDGYTVRLADRELHCKQLMIATGGVSYSGTGSTGDGYRFATNLGHTIVPPVAACVGIRCAGTTDFAGLSLKNVEVSIHKGGKKLTERFGEMLYTHTGVSGPVIMVMSSYVNRTDFRDMTLRIDMKPALDEATLDRRLIADLSVSPKKQLVHVVEGYLPKALVPEWLRRAGVNARKTAAEITKEERTRLVATLKAFTYPIQGLEPIEGAIVTAGGVSVKEINPKTFESKLCKGLYFGGEVMDVDCLTGGYNLQVAFATGYCAGLAMAAVQLENKA